MESFGSQAGRSTQVVWGDSPTSGVSRALASVGTLLWAVVVTVLAVSSVAFSGPPSGEAHVRDEISAAP